MEREEVDLGYVRLVFRDLDYITVNYTVWLLVNLFECLNSENKLELSIANLIIIG